LCIKRDDNTLQSGRREDVKAIWKNWIKYEWVFQEGKVNVSSVKILEAHLLVNNP
jgi:hypothetical protein